MDFRNASIEHVEITKDNPAIQQQVNRKMAELDWYDDMPIDKAEKDAALMSGVRATITNDVYENAVMMRRGLEMCCVAGSLKGIYYSDEELVLWALFSVMARKQVPELVGMEIGLRFSGMLIDAKDSLLAGA